MRADDDACPTCGAREARELRTVDRVLRRCLRCGSIYDRGPTVRRAVAMPPNIIVHEEEAALPGYREAAAPRSLVLVRRWFTAGAWGLLLFSLFWWSILAKWLTSSHPFMVFIIPHLAAGIALVYGTIAAFVNRTTVTVRDEVLSIRHGPLPWWGNVDVAVDDVAQLYTEEEIRQGKRGPTRTYHLGAVLRSGGRKRLLATLPEPEQALWLEQRIEDHLGIADAPVAGEYEGGRVPALRARDVS